MPNLREPKVHPIPILSLRPTQMTVGMREVKEKRQRFREHKSKKKQEDLIGRHMIPVVVGPDERYYVVDHHHLARALHDEGVKDILVTVIGDLTMVGKDAFWGVMDNKRWVYPYDAKGERRPFKDLPKTIEDLKDDPFRSRRIAPRRRLCQGHNAVFRIPLGRLPASPRPAQAGGGRFRPCDGEGACASEIQGRDLPAGLVRPVGG
jgi:hypothetical protein